MVSLCLPFNLNTFSLLRGSLARTSTIHESFFQRVLTRFVISLTLWLLNGPRGKQWQANISNEEDKRWLF